MKIRKTNKGVTMAEMLMVLGIITILSGLAFAGIVHHQRTLAQFERDKIAKEIFIAAQNHLTTAERQGFLGYMDDPDDTTRLGKPENPADSNVYYYVVNSGVPGDGIAKGFGQDSMLELMLPFGSVDETIRTGGGYIIRYQVKPARILDVFYVSRKESRFGYEFFNTSDNPDDPTDTYSKVCDLGSPDKKSDRRDYVNSGNHAVIGWYGGDAALNLETGEELKVPTINIKNGDRLLVEVTNPNTYNTNDGYYLKLIIKGVTSGAQKTFMIVNNGTRVKLESRVSIKDAEDAEDPENPEDPPALGDINNSEEYNVVLDDITKTEMHFVDIEADRDTETPAVPPAETVKFLPGENIIIYAKASNNKILTNVAESGKKETNSLFADGTEVRTVYAPDSYSTAKISSFRHLENLDRQRVSKLSTALANPQEKNNLNYNKAEQVSDLKWKKMSGLNHNIDGFVENLTTNNGSETVQPSVTYWPNLSTPITSTKPADYLPVEVDYNLSYDGHGHSISGVEIVGNGSYNNNAGLFGSNTMISDIKSLKLIDFKIKGINSAGVLAGSLSGSNVKNVVAYNTCTDSTSPINKDSKGYTAANATIEATGGSAGGLIGISSGGDINLCAASLIVKGTDHAGGLIGKADQLEDSNANPERGKYNPVTVNCCYSGGHTENGEYYNHNDTGERVTENPLYNVTATAGIAGGLIGEAVNTKISYSYSTCSVSAEGASGMAGGFIGKYSGEISQIYNSNDESRTITACYSTGLVNATTAYAFVADGDPTYNNTNHKENHYFSIINEVEKKDDNDNATGLEYLSPLSVDTTPPIIKALDDTASDYESFVGSHEWDKAQPYDSKLKEYYNKDSENKYNLMTVYQLYNKATGNPITKALDDDFPGDSYFVKNHYGDWPAPEIFVINQQ